eukprot:1750562-Amphidinium_carterae.1
MSGVPVERLKAFMDVSSEDAKAYARWGASTFAKQQFRATTSNSVNPSAEPLSVDMPTELGPERSRVDIMAVTKRCHTIVLGRKAVYVRETSEDEIPARVIPYVPGVEVVDADAKETLGQHKSGDPCDEHRFEEGSSWSVTIEQRMATRSPKPSYVSKRPRCGFAIPSMGGGDDPKEEGPTAKDETSPSPPKAPRMAVSFDDPDGGDLPQVGQCEEDC